MVVEDGAAAAPPVAVVDEVAIDHLDRLILSTAALQLGDDAEDPASELEPPPAPALLPAPPVVEELVLPPVQSSLQKAAVQSTIHAPQVQVAPPFWASDGEVESLAAAAEVAGSATDTEGGRARLAGALCDPRLLASPLFRSFSGRQRLHALLAALRASTPDAEGSRLASAAIAALAEALLRPLPPAPDSPGPGPFAEADVARLIDLAASFVEVPPMGLGRLDATRSLAQTCTTWASRSDPHHFLLPPRLCDRLALCAADLALPFASCPGPIYARALLLQANVHRVHDRTAPAIELYYEAWSELRRKGLVPSDEEAHLIPRLSLLLFETFQLRTALYVSGNAYVPPNAAGEDRTMAEFHVAFVTKTALRWRKEYAAAERMGRRCLEIAGRLDPRASSVLRIRVISDLIVIANHRMQPLSLFSFGQQIIELAYSLHDPTLPEVDILGYLRYVRLFAPARVAVNVCKLSVALIKRSAHSRGSPMLAHGLYQLGEAYLVTGDGPAAARCFAASLAALEPFFHLFPPEHPRRARLAFALSELRAGRLPRPVFPPPQYEPATTASGGKLDPPSPSPAAAPAPRSFKETFLVRRAMDIPVDTDSPPLSSPSDFDSPDTAVSSSGSTAASVPRQETTSAGVPVQVPASLGRRRRPSAPSDDEDPERPPRPPPVPDSGGDDCKCKPPPFALAAPMPMVEPSGRIARCALVAQHSEGPPPICLAAPVALNAPAASAWHAQAGPLQEQLQYASVPVFVPAPTPSSLQYL
eukprot:tig00000076_g2342.t1